MNRLLSLMREASMQRTARIALFITSLGAPCAFYTAPITAAAHATEAAQDPYRTSAIERLSEIDNRLFGAFVSLPQLLEQGSYKPATIAAVEMWLSAYVGAITPDIQRLMQTFDITDEELFEIADRAQEACEALHTALSSSFSTLPFPGTQRPSFTGLLFEIEERTLEAERLLPLIERLLEQVHNTWYRTFYAGWSRATTAFPPLKWAVTSTAIKGMLAAISAGYIQQALNQSYVTNPSQSVGRDVLRAGMTATLVPAILSGSAETGAVAALLNPDLVLQGLRKSLLTFHAAPRLRSAVLFATAYALIHKIDTMIDVSTGVAKIRDDIHNNLMGISDDLEKARYRTNDHITIDNPRFDYIRGQMTPLYDYIDLLKHPYTNKRAQRTVLFTGGSGSGKSLLIDAFYNQVRQVCAENGLPMPQLERVSPSDIMQGLFHKALKKAISTGEPTVIVIDELHLLQLQAGTNSGMLYEFLTKLIEINLDDSFDNRVFIIGATNRPELLAKELRENARRFGTVIQIPDPSYEHRLNLLKLLCSERGIDHGLLPLSRIARLTEGASMSKLVYLFESAVLEARRERKMLNAHHLYGALNSGIRMVNVGAPLPEASERKKLAGYWAARAAVTLALEEAHTEALAGGLPVFDTVTIMPLRERIFETYEFIQAFRSEEERKAQKRTQFGALFTFTKYPAARPTDDLLRWYCTNLIAGYAYEHMQGKGYSEQALEEYRTVYRTAYTFYLRGLTENDYSKDERAQIQRTARTFVDDCVSYAQSLLQNDAKSMQARIETLLYQQSYVTRDDLALPHPADRI